MSFCGDRVVIVTGAGRGIGRGEALEFAAHGAKVVVNDRGTNVHGGGQDGLVAQSVVDEIVQRGGVAIANDEDVSDWEGAQRLIRCAVETFGRLDVVVNNAGILRDRMLVNMTEDEWDTVIRVHLKGTFCISRWAAIYWRERFKAGDVIDARIINTSSPVAMYGNPGQTNYGAAKAGIIGFTIAASLELHRYGVTVNAIFPGARTRMVGNLESGDDDWFNLHSVPGFDFGAPENIASLVVWLGSSQSQGITGRVFNTAGSIIGVSEGWRPGPAKDRGERWDPTDIGRAMDDLLDTSVPVTSLREWLGI